MRLDDDANQQLYVSVALDLLRRYQQECKLPLFEDFVVELSELCGASSQLAPLTQRLRLLESVLVESTRNREIGLSEKHVALRDVVASGALVVADLTDPLLSPADANGLFQVLLEQFRACSVDAGKVLVLDEAHRYISGKSGFATAVVATTRVMRHEAMRVVVSTQSPLTLPPELLELASVAALHGFHSADWYNFLKSKLAIPEDGFATVRRLDPGEALLFAARAALGDGNGDGGEDGCECPVVRVRPRLTSDLGASRRTAG
mmetsp:Transcript_19530/g.60190  ORF Transcript_19530/g.60190 Transcript_19530/m.60190 type:complete len:262 (-) Transcript_19530:65-850(-)